MDISRNLCVLDKPTLNAICFPVLDDDFELQAFRRSEIAGIISIEQSPARAGSMLESWRIPPKVTEGILRHYSKLFYSDLVGQEGIKDLFVTEQDNQWIRERAAALAEDIVFASGVLQKIQGSDQKLVVHCINGRHRSPALATAVLLHHFPMANDGAILDMLSEACRIPACKNPTQLRVGEMAFIDAFFDRDSLLVREWGHRMNASGHAEFSIEKSFALQSIYAKALSAGRSCSGALARDLLRRLDG